MKRGILLFILALCLTSLLVSSCELFEQTELEKEMEEKTKQAREEGLLREITIITRSGEKIIFKGKINVEFSGDIMRLIHNQGKEIRKKHIIRLGNEDTVIVKEL